MWQKHPGRMDIFFKKRRNQDDFHAKGLLEAKEKLDSLKLPEPEKQNTRILGEFTLSKKHGCV